MQIHSLPPGGAFRVGEIEVSPVTAVHKTALRSEIQGYKNTRAGFRFLKCAVLMFIQ